MPSRPIRIDHQGQIYTIDYNDDDEFDIEVVKAQIYSMTDIQPNMQEFVPELEFHNLNRTLKLSIRSLEPEIDPQVVLSSIDWQAGCSRIWLGDEPTLQPATVHGDFRLCIPCASSCWSQIKLEPSLDSQGFVCQCDKRCLFKSRVCSRNELLVEPFRGYLAQALKNQQVLQEKMTISRGNAAFNARIQSNLRQIEDFEDAENQQRALAVIPLETLVERGTARGTDALSPRDELIFQLLNWFKNEFFQWVNSPPCEQCGKETLARGATVPSPEERRFGAGIVEMHQCRACGVITRFPRYNHSGKLMETRRGRCGEWAQAFVLCCRALKFDTRFVVDWTDHVWAEVYSEAKQRWVHCDPCENRYDAPLLYEAGWGKKLTYVVAFSVDEVRDVTRRYTAKFESEVLARRRDCEEDWLAAILENINQSRQMQKHSRAILIKQRWTREFEELKTKTSEKQTLHGRQTGTVEWRLARGELGQSASDDAKPSQSQAQAVSLNSSNDVKLSKSQLQQLIKAYFSQMTIGCGKHDCKNSEYCCSAPGSTVKSMPHKQLLSKSIVVVRDCLDGKLCAKFQPLH